MAALMLILLSGRAEARLLTFDPGSFIIPMDTTYQPLGLFKAFGLINKLLLANVPVHWAIKPGKMVGNPGDADFTASAVDIQSNAVITSNGYRGGPFLIAAADAATASPIIAAWQASNVTVVHRVTASFDANIARTLTAAPTIGIFADGNESIAFGYLNAAGILDRNGHPWPSGKLASYSAYPDVLTIADVAGPSYTNPRDGRLFDANGVPVFCQIMSMHWNCNTGCGKPDPEQDAVVAEMAEFLRYPTHVFAECQAVTAIERNPNGHFVASQGVWMDANPTTALTYRQADLPFAQMDGPYQNPGGSEPSYSLCDPAGHDGDTYPNCTKNAYYDNGIVMVTQTTTPLVGVKDIWMTGYAKGTCTIELNDSCTSGGGKVSYLGGHAYTTALPLSKNPKSQGTRLFLNSLFEALCTVAEGQPLMFLEVVGDDFTSAATVTYTIRYGNDGTGTAVGATLDYPLPGNTTFVSATDGGTLSGGHVTWSLGNLGGSSSGTVQVTVSLASYATYVNTAKISYQVGLNSRSLTSEGFITTYAAGCTRNCDAVVCGASDGCGGTCELDAGCCTPVCADMACGTANGCGGACAVGSGCICTPRCTGVLCGSPDGCGGACVAGSGCTCIPVCDGLACGSDDGCGAVCYSGSGCDCPDGGSCGASDGGVADAAADVPWSGIDSAAGMGGAGGGGSAGIGGTGAGGAGGGAGASGGSSGSGDGSAGSGDALIAIEDGGLADDGPAATGDGSRTGVDGGMTAALDAPAGRDASGITVDAPAVMADAAGTAGDRPAAVDGQLHDASKGGGGCNCNVAARGEPGAAGLFALLGLALVGIGRRRRLRRGRNTED